MTGTDLAFLAFALGAVISGLAVVTRRSPIYATLNLIVLLGCVAGVFALLHAPFLAVIEVIVYAGAVVVLFLFVIMLLNLREMSENDPPGLHLGPALVALAAFWLLVTAVVRSPTASATAPPAPPVAADWGGTAQMGKLLFERYAFAFELVSVLLLAAMIGTVVLARRYRTRRDEVPAATPPAAPEPVGAASDSHSHGGHA